MIRWMEITPMYLLDMLRVQFFDLKFVRLTKVGANVGTLDTNMVTTNEVFKSENELPVV